MYVAVTLDSLGQRYSLLPSEVMERATTFDLQVADLAMSYQRLQQNKSNGVMPEVKPEVLLEAINLVRGQ